MSQVESLEITIHQGHQPSLEPAHARVVIDVIRAFTTTQIALKKGAHRILLAGELPEARALREAHPSRLLAGERNALAPPDFDLGNSPTEFDAAKLAGRELVLTTSNGVRATLHAWHDGPLLVTGFANAGTTAAALQALIDNGTRRIQLLASHPSGDEDLACAQWIKARLAGLNKPDDHQVRRRILECAAAEKFLDPKRPEYRSRDIDYCARRADVDWAMVVETKEEQLSVIRRPLDSFFTAPSPR